MHVSICGGTYCITAHYKVHVFTSEMEIFQQWGEFIVIYTHVPLSEEVTVAVFK